MDYTKQSPIILSLCPGMRGLERGLERACQQLAWQRPTTAAYVEIEAFVCYNLVRQMEQGLLAPAPVHTNIKTFDGSPFRGKIHGILGGYPCQPFSTAGKRKGTEDPRHLWPYIQGIIESTRPVFCFFENVDDHLTLGFDEVYRSLVDLGYRVEGGIYTAEEVGAPHERKRLFILAIKMDHAFSGRQWRPEEEICAGRNTAVFSGKTMADASRAGIGREARNILEKNGRQDIELPQQSFRSGEKMGNTLKPGIQRGWTWQQKGLSEYSIPGEKLAHTAVPGQPAKRHNRKPPQPHNDRTEHTSADRWPSPPGTQQYSWEAPRVKPSVGYAINGYNFREDLLRLAGNAVVEQTAELAFLDLLQKHFN